MFLGGYQADEHVVFLSESPGAMKKQVEMKTTNIFSPGRLKPGQTYYWRVDTVCGGNTINGLIWKFSVGAE